MQTLKEMNEHYKAVRERLNFYPPKKIVFMAPPAEPVVEQQKPVEYQPTLLPLSRTQAILHEVALKYGVEVKDIKGLSRKVKFVRARQEAAYEIRKRLNLSLFLIGKAIGKRDHTTALHAIRKHAQINNLPQLSLFKGSREKMYSGGK